MTIEPSCNGKGEKVNIEPNTPMVFGYGSKGHIDGELSEADQREQCEAWFAAQQTAGQLTGYAWEGWWCDCLLLVDQGRWFHRPYAEVMLRRLHCEDVIVVASLDRATRSKRDFHETHWSLREHAVRIVYLAEGIDTATMPNTELAKLWTPSVESRMASHRQRVALQHMKRNGWPISGFAPLGWKKCGSRGESRFKPDYEERALCNYIVQLKEEDGLSFAAIQIHFRKCGVTHHHMNRRDFRAKLAAGDRWGWSAERLWRGYHAAKAGFPKISAKDMLAELRANGGLLRTGRAARSHC